MTSCKALLIGLLIIPLSACGLGGTRREYPPDWLIRSGAPQNCKDAHGIFDDNRSAENNITQAYWAFRLDPSEIRVNSHNAEKRSFSLYIDDHDVIHIDYAIDGVMVSKLEFKKDMYTCEHDGIHVTTQSGWHEATEKFLRYDVNSKSWLVLSLDDKWLIVEQNFTGTQWVYGFFPIPINDRHWYRFEKLQQGRVGFSPPT